MTVDPGVGAESVCSPLLQGAGFGTVAFFSSLSLRVEGEVFFLLLNPFNYLKLKLCTKYVQNMWIKDDSSRVQ